MRAAGGTLVAAKSAPIGAAAKMAVVSADFLRKYGRAGLIGFILRNEFMQSFSTLKGLLGDLDDLGFQDAAIGTYYFMAMNRVTVVQSQKERRKATTVKESKTALVLIRGSKSVQDALTDIQAYPEEIGLSSAGAPQSEATGGFVDAFAHNGMLKAVMWIKDRIVKSLRVLHNEGYHILDVAALLSVMLQKEFEDLECFAYAVPACVNLGVAESCNGFVHSIVLRDDIVPRAKASNVMKLTLWAPRKREWAKEAADQRKGKLANRDKDTSPTDKPTLAEKNAKEADKDEGVLSWTLTRTNLIDQLDKIGDKSTEDETLEPSDEARHEEEKVAAELVTTLGIYEAVHVDRKCEELSHIPVQQNMLSDHLGCNYLSALRVVRDARRAKPTLPEWVPFSTKTRCMCCDSPFTWNSTSSSEAQQNRDQHNCRRCGALVCEGCSQKFKSIPEFGINVPVRVCDRCYYEA
ncbi:Alpha/Beta hydrolase fold [Phytophthora cactorum]|nr:Alpha/Beta hydrolase fold [Phytophthora cactorum]